MWRHLSSAGGRSVGNSGNYVTGQMVRGRESALDLAVCIPPHTALGNLQLVPCLYSPGPRTPASSRPSTISNAGNHCKSSASTKQEVSALVTVPLLVEYHLGVGSYAPPIVIRLFIPLRGLREICVLGPSREGALYSVPRRLETNPRGNLHSGGQGTQDPANPSSATGPKSSDSSSRCGLHPGEEGTGEPPGPSSEPGTLSSDPSSSCSTRRSAAGASSGSSESLFLVDRDLKCIFRNALNRLFFIRPSM